MRDKSLGDAFAPCARGEPVQERREILIREGQRKRDQRFSELQEFTDKATVQVLEAHVRLFEAEGSTIAVI